VAEVSTRVAEFIFDAGDADGFNYSHGQTPTDFEHARQMTKKLHHSVFKGIANNNNTTARGKQVWTDGTTYEGSYRDGLFNGKGRLISNDGNLFEGEFENNSGKPNPSP
jgi:hypothetical protein